MSTRFFSSPKTASAAAAIAPAKLAATSDADVRWRTRSDGTLEVVEAHDDGRVDRYVVNDDGTTTPGDLVPLSFAYRWGRQVPTYGWAIGLGVLAVGGLAGSTVIAVAAFITVAVLFLVGGIAYSRSVDFDKRLDGGGWHEPTDLHGWVPRTGAQLAAVEQIADANDGLVYVHDGGRTVDVYAMRRGKVALRWVDEAGNSGVTSLESYSGRHKLDRVLRRFDLDEFMKHRPQDGSEWIEIRTRLVVNAD